MVSQKLSLTAFALSIATFLGCNIAMGELIRGSGIKAIRSEAIGEIRHLTVSNALKVKVFCGEEPGVEITGDDNIVSHVILTEDDGRLSMKLESGSYSEKLPLEVVVSCASLESIGVSGACKVEIAGVDSDEFELEASGASQVALEGRADELVIKAASASKIKSTECTSANVKAYGSGASKIKVLATKSIRGDLSGASRLSYAGEPADSKFDTSGASKVSQLETAQ